MLRPNPGYPFSGCTNRSLPRSNSNFVQTCSAPGINQSRMIFAPKIIHLLPFGYSNNLDEFFKKKLRPRSILCPSQICSAERDSPRSSDVKRCFSALSGMDIFLHILICRICQKGYDKKLKENDCILLNKNYIITNKTLQFHQNCPNPNISTRLHCTLGLPWRRSQSASDSYSAIPFSPFRIDLSSRK